MKKKRKKSERSSRLLRSVLSAPSSAIAAPTRRRAGQLANGRAAMSPAAAQAYLSSLSILSPFCHSEQGTRKYELRSPWILRNSNRRLTTSPQHSCHRRLASARHHGLRVFEGAMERDRGQRRGPAELEYLSELSHGACLSFGVGLTSDHSTGSFETRGPNRRVVHTSEREAGLSTPTI